MACLIQKTVHGHRYWQIVTSQRVQGKPRQVVLAHLGTADALLARLQQQKPGLPLKARVHQFGLLAAAWQLAQKLQLVPLIDRHVPKRHQGASIGQYLLLATLNRLASPTSKAGMLDWYQKTALRRWLPLAPRQLRSQRFWDAMHAVDEQAVRRIEKDLSRRLVQDFGIDTRCLCFDCTNFDTFIDSRTPSELAQRGPAKSKRTDLRLIGLALLVSTDFNIPLFFQTYAGNQHDSVTFASVTEELVARYRLLAQNCEHISLVFDKGNNSQDNLEKMADSSYHVVGSLVPSQHPDLLAVPLRKFRPLDDPDLAGVSAYRTKKKVLGRDWTIVVTRSQELLQGQLRGIAQTLRKRRRALAELQRKVEKSQEPGAQGKGYTYESLRAHAEKLSSGQYIREILHVKVSQRRSHLRVSYRTDAQALRRLTTTILGKRILFTDNHNWGNRRIIHAYRSQHHVEAAFRTMKNPHFLGWDPMHHWTDQKIRVHALYCVLALTLAGLLHRQIRQAGVEVSLEARLKPDRLNSLVFGVFAAVALAIAVVGVAGVLAFSVSARTREFGIRMALGSQPQNLLRAVLAEGAAMAAAGVFAGAAFGFALARVAGRYFLDVKMPGTLPVFVSAFVLMTVAVIASVLPAARAARVDVMQALRSE